MNVNVDMINMSVRVPFKLNVLSLNRTSFETKTYIMRTPYLLNFGPTLTLPLPPSL